MRLRRIARAMLASVLVAAAVWMANGQWIGDREIAWPSAPRADASTISLREFHAPPGGQAYTAFRVERGQFLGTPSYRWIGARGRVSTRYTISLTEVASTFAGVDAVDVSPDGLSLRERGTGRSVAVDGNPAR